MPQDSFQIELEVNKAYARSLRYLSYRPRSQKELESYLTKKETDPLIIQSVIDMLISQKFLDDDEFTQWWIRGRQGGRARSKNLIKLELRQKGISEEIIEENLENAKDDLTTAQEYFEKHKRKFERYKGPDRFQKEAAFLSRRGFSWDIIKKVIKND